MAKIFTYVVTILSVLVLMNIAGLSTTSTLLLDAVGFSDPAGFSGATLFAELIAILALAVGTSIVVGLYTSQATTQYFIATLAGYLTIWCGSDLIGLYLTMKDSCPVGSGCEWMTSLILFLIIPLMGGFVIAMVSWWQGND